MLKEEKNLSAESNMGTNMQSRTLDSKSMGATSKSASVERRSGISIMGKMIGLVKPLMHVMALAIFLGVVGYLCAIFLTVLASQVLVKGAVAKGIVAPSLFTGTLASLSYNKIFIVMGVAAVMRGVLHYGEQYCNHYIAFKLLAIIRHRVFEALRKLCPAKLEGRDKGNLISIITTDIELLEVFYAHTISPIAIGTITSLIMILFIGSYSLIAGMLAAMGYITVGVIIPLANGKRGGSKGMEFRNEFGELNSFVLDSLRGLDETIQFDDGRNRSAEMLNRTTKLGGLQRKLSSLEGSQRAVTNSAILCFSFGMLFLTIFQFNNGSLSFEGMMTCTVAMMGSFGPVVALSSLSNNLNQTLASGERVLNLLEEKPVVEEIYEDGLDIDEFTGAEFRNVSFSYGNDNILENFTLDIAKNKILGICGPSGCGKSTMLKLLMRFWQCDSGEIDISGKDVNEISTAQLRNNVSYVTQETHLFHDTIMNNIRIAKLDATDEEVIKAAKKSAIHDFIMSLPEGYQTEVGELGDTLSGGEKQRIGVARAFLHGGPFILLDEPTSNLDSLNEGIILKSLKESSENKTIVIVSHRESTMKIADERLDIYSDRAS